MRRVTEFLAPLFLMVMATTAFAQTPSWDDPSWYAAPANPLNLDLTANSSAAAEALIGSAGGALKLQTPQGDTFTLTIPELALLEDTNISMAPVTGAKGLPEGAGPFSGVIFKPEGLHLDRTAMLEITTAQPIPPEYRALWGFYASGADARGEIAVSGLGDRIVVPVEHFSGAGVSFADRLNLQLDRWHQAALQDRVKSQLGQMQREVAQGLQDGTDMWNEYTINSTRVIRHGLDAVLRHPTATCSDALDAIRTMSGIEKQRMLVGLDVQVLDIGTLYTYLEKSWSLCLKQELQVCLDTGALQVLQSFLMRYMRQITHLQVLAYPDLPDVSSEKIAEVRAAMERCGRYKLEITATGNWHDPSDVAGELAFRVDVPLRVVFDGPEDIVYHLEGEAPATEVSVSFRDSECWKYRGYRNGTAMKAVIRDMQFTIGGAFRPLSMTTTFTAPEIFVDISCDGYQMQPPMSPMVWAVAHRAERSGDNFTLSKFKGLSHPTLFEMEWTGQGVDDGMNATDKTRLRLIHIAQ